MDEQNSVISPLLDRLTCDLIGYCLDALADGEELWPTLAHSASSALSAPSGEAVILTFKDDTLEGCLEAARDFVKTLPQDIKAYAIAYNGFVQLDESGETTDALLVEFSERGMVCAYSAYIPYARGRKAEDFFAGEPLAAGEEENLFT